MATEDIILINSIMRDLEDPDLVGIAITSIEKYGWDRFLH